MNSLYDESEYLEHYGIKGMKWGERRFQDENGRLTPLGKVRYGLGKLTGSAYGKDAVDFDQAARYYSSWAESHQKIRDDEIAKAIDYQRQLEKVKKQRNDYAASPGATAKKLAEYDKEIARLEKIIKMYSEPDMYTSPENIAREQRSANRMRANVKASLSQYDNAPKRVAAEVFGQTVRENADKFVETVASTGSKAVKKGKKVLSNLLKKLGNTIAPEHIEVSTWDKETGDWIKVSK